MALELQIKPRDKKKPGALRREGQIPATLYGPEIESTNIQLNAKDFSKLPVSDYNHLIHLKNADSKEDHEVLIKKIQRDFVSREVLNIEFYKVMRGHKVTMKVGLKFINTSNAVKMGADLVVVYKEAHVRCLPKDIPYILEVDISKLENDGDVFTFADLNVNRAQVEILDPDNEIICKAESKRIDHTIEPDPVVETAAVPTVEEAKSDKAADAG